MSRSRTVGLFVLITLLFGGAFPAIKVGVSDVPPLLFAAVRYYISGAILFGIAVVTGRQWLPKTRSDRLAVAAGGALFIGGTGLNFVGLQFTTSGISAIIFALIPVLTVVASWVLLPTERASWQSVLGVLVGFAGVTLVVSSGAALDTAVGVVGNLFVLAAAVSVALGTVLVRRAHPTMSVVPLTAWAMIVGATIQLSFSVGFGESMSDVTLTQESVIAMIYLAVFAGGLAFVIYFQLIEQIGPTQVNMLSYLAPVVALSIGWAMLGEQVSPSSVVGFVVILVGFLVMEEREIVAELSHFRGAGR